MRRETKNGSVVGLFRNAFGTEFLPNGGEVDKKKQLKNSA